MWFHIYNFCIPFFKWYFQNCISLWPPVLDEPLMLRRRTESLSILPKFIQLVKMAEPDLISDCPELDYTLCFTLILHGLGKLKRKKAYMSMPSPSNSFFCKSFILFMNVTSLKWNWIYHQFHFNAKYLYDDDYDKSTNTTIIPFFKVFLVLNNFLKIR